MQMGQLETMLGAERSERARAESKRSQLQGQVLYQEGAEGDALRRLNHSLEEERVRARELEMRLRQREEVIRVHEEKALKFERMATKYSRDLSDHESNIERLEMAASRTSLRSSDEEEEEEEEEE